MTLADESHGDSDFDTPELSNSPLAEDPAADGSTSVSYSNEVGGR